MFIQLLIYNYNAYELLLVASKLAFAFKCMGHINTYNGIVVLLLIEKKKTTEDISTHCFGFA